MPVSSLVYGLILLPQPSQRCCEDRVTREVLYCRDLLLDPSTSTPAPMQLPTQPNSNHRPPQLKTLQWFPTGFKLQTTGARLVGRAHLSSRISLSPLCTPAAPHPFLVSMWLPQGLCTCSSWFLTCSFPDSFKSSGISINGTFQRTPLETFTYVAPSPHPFLSCHLAFLYVQAPTPLCSYLTYSLLVHCHPH